MLMKQVCDLHTHSVFSDGTDRPAQLIREAERIGLTAIALTDHNTVAGLPEFLAAAENTQVEAVPGIEFSTDYQGLDLHIVGLFVKPAVFAQVTELMEAGVRKKEESNLALAAALKKAGYPLDYEAIRDATPNGQVNRAHIAAAMVKKGWVSSIQEAFPRFLNPECGFYTPPKRPGAYEILDFIHEIGAVSVMAHPFLKLDEAGVRKFLDEACRHHLTAMETEYVSFTPEQTRCARQIVRDFGLLPSGGSDYHGDNKPGIFLGVGRGNLEVPAEIYQNLKQACL